MKNAFEHHGVFYLSPSTINLWVSQPALCLLKIAGINDGEAGPAAWRGSGADKAITQAAFDPSIPDHVLISRATDVFDEQLNQAQNPQVEEKVTKEREAMSDYIKVGAKFYRELKEKPESDQGKVTVKVEDLPIPTIGYYDLLYKDKVRDIKTVSRQVSNLTQGHCRQASIYALGTGKEPWLDYVSKKEVRAFKVDNVDYWLRQYYGAAMSLYKVLSHSEDIFECCQLVYPDLDHWMWGDTTKATAIDVWNMEGLTK